MTKAIEAKIIIMDTAECPIYILEVGDRQIELEWNNTVCQWLDDVLKNDR